MEFLMQIYPILLTVFLIMIPIRILYWCYIKINYYISLKEDQNSLIEELIDELKKQKLNA